MALSLIAIISLSFIFSLTLLYWHLLPKPYPGIPHNRASAQRILGDLPELLAQYKKTKEVAPFCFSQCKKLRSPIVQLFLRPGSRPFLWLDDAREAEDILLRRTREFDRAPSTIAFFKPLIPNASLVKPSNHEFKSQRRLWMDVMSPSFLRDVIAPNVYKASCELVELWGIKAALSDSRPFRAQVDFELAAFDAIWVAILGSELGCVRQEIDVVKAAQNIEYPKSKAGAIEFPTGPRPKIYKALEYLNETVGKIMASPSPIWHHWIIRQTSKYKVMIDLKDREIRDLMKDARARFSKTMSADTAQEDYDTCAMDLVLRREILAAQKAGMELLELDAMQDELLMLLVAGHETTATTLSWTVKLLAANSSAQTRLRRSLQSAFPYTAFPSVSEILGASIPYLSASLEEINRLANTVPLIVRVATVDTEILGYHVPAGTHIMANAQFLAPPQDIPDKRRSKSSLAARERRGRGYAPTAMEDLDSFRPERWLTRAEGDEIFDEGALTRLAFSLGPRGCFGKKMAMQELKIMLVLLVLSFEFLPMSEGLGGLLGEQRVLRTPQQCYVKLKCL